MKVNCFGNYDISMFWEEKLMLLLRALQLFGLLYVAFIEQWPWIDGEQGMYLFGTNYVYYVSGGYYTLITNWVPFFTNMIVWICFSVFCAMVVCCCVCCIWCSWRVKYSRLLFKKWLFNIVELMYFPLLVNIIPYGACSMTTNRQGFVQHNCFESSDKDLRGFMHAIAAFGIIFGLLYIAF